MSGFLNIIKPPGMTSFGVVARVKELIDESRVGHGGTLDPDAAGVLPVALGQATRLIECLSDATKLYRADIELGVTTDTYDASGIVISKKDPTGIKRETVEVALTSFSGVIQQVPPMYSALRYKGSRLYKLARKGIEVERPARPAHVYGIQLVDFQNPIVTVEIECGKGTYIRSIANDLGEKLGIGAHMSRLTRLRVGPFDIKDGITLGELDETCCFGFFERYIYAPDTVLLKHNVAVISFEKEDAIRKGQKIQLDIKSHFFFCDALRIYSLDGRFVGLAKYDGESDGWQPEKIFN